MYINIVIKCIVTLQYLIHRLIVHIYICRNALVINVAFLFDTIFLCIIYLTLCFVISADKDTVIGIASSPILGKTPTTGKGWGSLFKGSSGGALEDITDGDVLDPFQRGGVRATAAPRLQSTQGISNRWYET